MHPTIYEIGRKFFQTYPLPAAAKILEIGAKNVNGTLRDFQPVGTTWCGLDLSAGPDVDVVLEDPYRYPFEDGMFDLVLSSSCYEHDPMFWLTFAESCRVLSPTGVIYINAPTAGIYHGWPNDHWRMWVDAGMALQAWGMRLGYPIRLIESFVDCQGATNAAFWNDLTMIFSKNSSLVCISRLADQVSNASDIRVGSAVERIRPIL